MKNLRFAVFGVILTGAVAVAVSSLFAQPAQVPQPREPRERARIMALDARGSQIGVIVEDLSSEDLKGLSGVTSGVRIEEVDQDGPAAKAGLREGDVVVELDGERVRSARQFSRLVQETAAGRVVKLGIVRNGQAQTVEVTPDSRAMAWSGGLIGGEIARGMRDFGPRLREMEPYLRRIEPRLRDIEPRLREFRIDPPGFDFSFGDVFPGGMRGRLGVQLQSLSPQLAEYFGVKEGGVLVSSVTDNSPAAKAGLKAGDVIVSIDGDRVRDDNDLMSELRDKTGEVTIGIVRDKKESTVKATIDEPERRLPRLRRPA